ncbi:MAG: hypothetical protein WDN26_03915 [Chitinophagaceae bacterium]
MGRRKLERLKDIDKANSRLAALKSIDPALDLGNGLTVAGYAAEVNTFNQQLNQYNTALSVVDDKYNTCLLSLANIQDWNERMLAGVASKYGKKSSEYEMAGGTRKPERRKGNVKPAKS